MAPSTKFEALAIRVTHSEHLDWKTLFPESIFCISVMELSQKGVAHTHTALQLDRALARTTVLSRIKKLYPMLSGNGRISVKKWDGREEYLDYIHKTIVLDPTDVIGENAIGSWKRYGERIHARAAAEYRERFYQNQENYKQQKKTAVEWCVDRLSDLPPEKVTSMVVTATLYAYYSDHCQGNVNGNTWQVVATARKIMFSLKHKDPDFRQSWLVKVHDLL